MIEFEKLFNSELHGEIKAVIRVLENGARVELKFKYLNGTNMVYPVASFCKAPFDGDILKAGNYLNSLTEKKAEQLVTNVKNGFNP